MTLVVEDGTGKADAECYAGLTWHNAYQVSQGRPAWALLSESDREVAIRKVRVSLDGRFRHRFRGRKKTTAQRMQFPRLYLYDSGTGELLPDTTVPEAMLEAEAELAWLASQGDKDLEPELERGGRILKEWAGPTGVVYDHGAPGTTTRPRIQLILGELLHPAGRIIRA